MTKLTTEELEERLLKELQILYNRGWLRGNEYDVDEEPSLDANKEKENKKRTLEALKGIIEEVIESVKPERKVDEVEVEGCQAAHEGNKCLHCNEDPCPHCKHWGGRERTEKRPDKKFNQCLDQLDNNVKELLGE